MNLLDWDCDDDRYEITVEANYKELYHTAFAIEHVLKQLQPDDKKQCKKYMI